MAFASRAGGTTFDGGYLEERQRREPDGMTPLSIFISSVQSEFARERMVLRDYLRGDVLMRRFFDVFL